MSDKINIIPFFLIFLVPLSVTATQKIPSSHRSQVVISRVEAKLKKDFSSKGLTYASPVYMRIFKEEKELEVWVEEKQQFKFFKKYSICTYGKGSLGPKIKQGDKQAPEGFYSVTPNQLNPVSQYHLAFNLGYPNEYDRFHNRTGSALMVHGACVSIGCFAMTDEQIDEIYAIADAALRNGQSNFRVHIFPFRMTKENMNRHLMDKENILNWHAFWQKLKGFYFKITNREIKMNSELERYSFWRNLKKGYDFFEKYGNIPPDVEVINGLYVFNKPK